MTDNLKRPVDLQLFAEEPAQSEGTQTLEEFLDNYEQQEEAQDEREEVEEEPESQVSEPEPEPELILGKFKSQEDLINAYSAAEKKIHEQGQALSQTQKQVQDQMVQVQSYLAQIAEAQKAPEQQVMDEDQQYEWLSKFNERPLEALKEYVEKYVDPAIKQMVEPLQQKVNHYETMENWNRQVQEVSQKHQDFQELIPVMQDVIKEQGEYIKNMPNAVETAYNLAKARQADKIPKPDDLLNDDKFIEKILGSEKIQRKFQETYAKKVKDKKTPVVIGKQPGGQSPASPPDSIKSTDDAHNAFKAFLNKLGGS